MSSQREEFLKIFDSIDFHRIKDHPNILIAAHFWEEERYNAARVCYKFLRAIDDLIDNHKAEKKIISPEERNQFISNVSEWIRMFTVSGSDDPLQEELLETITKFRIPEWAMKDFARSMIYDINNDGFSTLGAFIEYSQGASVAPASIFVHLAGLVKKDGLFSDPVFDVKSTATPCAVFSYLVHIIRDFQKDQLNNLNYFADDLTAQHRLSRHDLKEIAWGHPVSQNFRDLVSVYYRLAAKYRDLTKRIMEKVCPLLEPRYRLSLEIIFDLYLMVYERIDIVNGKFTSDELNPTPEETKERVYRRILTFA
ncbi:MAG: squalene/phytoene synthase family protein [Bacteroidota bacterium]